MDVLESTPRRPGPATAVGVALVLLAAGQAAAVQRTPPLPDDVRLQVPLENYFFAQEAEGPAVSFELRNAGDRAVRIVDVGALVPGVELLDTTVAGEAVGFRRVGAGADLVPAFDLPPGDNVVVTLVYRAVDCAAVPTEDAPVTVRARSGRARGDLQVRLPPLPDDRAGAAEDDEVPWQVRLVAEQCA